VPLDGGEEPPEVMMRLAWRCDDKADVQRLMRDAGLLGLGGPPGVTPFGRARDRPSQLLALDAIEVDPALLADGIAVSVEES
jgi:hypothetical protein